METQNNVGYSNQMLALLPTEKAAEIFGNDWQLQSFENRAVAADQYFTKCVQSDKEQQANLAAVLWYQYVTKSWLTSGFKSWQDYCLSIQYRHKVFESSKKIERFIRAYQFWYIDLKYPFQLLETHGVEVLGTLADEELIPNRERAEIWLDRLESFTFKEVLIRMAEEKDRLASPRVAERGMVTSTNQPTKSVSDFLLSPTIPANPIADYQEEDAYTPEEDVEDREEKESLSIGFDEEDFQEFEEEEVGEEIKDIFSNSATDPLSRALDLRLRIVKKNIADSGPQFVLMLFAGNKLVDKLVASKVDFEYVEEGRETEIERAAHTMEMAKEINRILNT